MDCHFSQSCEIDERNNILSTFCAHLIKHHRTVDNLGRVVDNQNFSQFEWFSVVHDRRSEDQDCVEVAHHHEERGKGARHQRPAARSGI